MKLILALGSVLLATGCSSLPPQKAEADTIMVCDTAKVADVQRVTKGRADVRWFRCPLIARDKVTLPPTAPNDTPHGPAG